MSLHYPEKFRTHGRFGEEGAFNVTLLRGGHLFVIASGGEGWEHVSVSRRDRTPLWDEMCEVKDIFWDEEDCVVQYHPPRSAYVNLHPYCLHLWRSRDTEIILPKEYLI